MKLRPLIGLAGVLLAVMAGDLNDSVGSTALVEIRSSLGIGVDAGTWIDSLYLAAQPIGMAISAWFMVTFSLRYWAIFVIALVGVTSFLIPFSPNIETLYALRILQGLSGGLITPLLMDTALFVLPPPIRLYGLAVYALTATFVPSLAATVAALWTDVLAWQYVFYQAIPLCTVGALLVWYGLPQEQSHFERFKQFDWRALVLIILGASTLNTVLFQGNRLDWFNSKLICCMTLISAICFPLLLINEWFHPLPLFKLQMLKRRNFIYGVVGLFGFITVSVAFGSVPLTFLEEVGGFRPIQAHLITLEIALAQLILLPLIAILLNFRQVDARFVSVIGFVLMIISCIGSSHVTVVWDRQQFFFWQGLAAIGQPLVVMSLLMMATNTVVALEEAPWASAMVNFPRSIAEVVGVWIVDLANRWRGGLHSDSIVDQVGHDRWRSIQGQGLLPQHPAPLLANGHPRVPGGLEAFSHAVEKQVQVLTIADTFLIFAGLLAFLTVIVILLPVRTLPPRLAAVEL